MHNAPPCIAMYAYSIYIHVYIHTHVWSRVWGSISQGSVKYLVAINTSQATQFGHFWKMSKMLGSLQPGIES